MALSTRPRSSGRIVVNGVVTVVGSMESGGDCGIQHQPNTSEIKSVNE